MAAIEVEFGPLSLEVLRALTEALNRGPGMAAAAPRPKDDGTEYLSMRAFCQKFDIGATTVKRRVMEGMVEKSRCGGKTPRYRWAAGYGNRA